MIDVEARLLLQRLQYQAESATISKDDKYLLCNMGQVRSSPSYVLSCQVKSSQPDRSI